MILGIHRDDDNPSHPIEVIESVFDELGEWSGCIIAIDDSADITDFDMTLFHMTANMDPGRDLVWNGHRLGIDATSKSEAHERNGQPVRKWPPPIAMDPEIVEFARQFVSGSTQEA